MKNNHSTLFYPKKSVTITLGENKKHSIQKAKGTVILKIKDNTVISLNQITQQPQSFTLKTDTNVKIDEIDFSGDNEMNKEAKVTVSKVKVQPHSTGSINNAIIENIVLAPLSSLDINEGVDLSEASVNLPLYVKNEENNKALLTGELEKAPKNISFSNRGIDYLSETQDRLLVAESHIAEFKNQYCEN